MVMWEMIKIQLRNQKGQGMVEYGLILALIAVAAVAAMTTMGTSVKTMFETTAGKL